MRPCALLFALLLAPGCMGFNSYRPISIEARDAETKKPIPNAEVRITYPLANNSTFAPTNSTGNTGANGIVRLQAKPFGELGIVIDVTAEGYLDENTRLSTDDVEALQPAGFFEDVDKRPVRVVVELYSGPSPTVELVLPPGFHGLFEPEIVIRPDSPIAPGQRCFRYVVEPDGKGMLVGPPMLARAYATDFHARTADGTLLKDSADGLDFAFWCVKWDAKHPQFLVGTRLEYESARRDALSSEATEVHPSGNGKSSGQGRRGRKGNQQSSDSGN